MEENNRIDSLAPVSSGAFIFLDLLVTCGQITLDTDLREEYNGNMNKREIKFRAWDKEFKEILYLGEGGEDILFFENGNIYLTENHDGNGFVMENFILMQYTGLKDKNGKEIYEGDIVKIGYVGDVVSLEVIAWEPPYLLQKVKGNPEHKVVDDDLSYSEVVGNIYENGELIK